MRRQRRRSAGCSHSVTWYPQAFVTKVDCPVMSRQVQKGDNGRVINCHAIATICLSKLDPGHICALLAGSQLLRHWRSYAVGRRRTDCEAFTSGCRTLMCLKTSTPGSVGPKAALCRCFLVHGPAASRRCHAFPCRDAGRMSRPDPFSLGTYANTQQNQQR